MIIKILIWAENLEKMMFNLLEIFLRLQKKGTMRDLRMVANVNFVMWCTFTELILRYKETIFLQMVRSARFSLLIDRRWVIKKCSYNIQK